MASEASPALAEASQPPAAIASDGLDVYLDEAYEQVDKVEPPRPIYSEKIPTARLQRNAATLQRNAAPPPAKSLGAKMASAKQLSKKPVSAGRLRARRLAILVCLPIIVSLVGGAIYLYLMPTMKPEKVEPHTAIMAMTRLRQMKSNDAWLTVDERMMQEVQRSRNEGKLRGYQGWTVSDIEGDKNKLLIKFTFDETDGSQQRAEWLTDLVSNTYTAQTELALAVYNR